MPTLAERIRENPEELDLLIRHCAGSITASSSEELAATIKKVINKTVGKEYPWPGNVRELEQCVREIISYREYGGDLSTSSTDPICALVDETRNEPLTADTLLSRYCRVLYERHGSLETVGSITKLDWRTVRRYIGGARQYRAVEHSDISQN